MDGKEIWKDVNGFEGFYQVSNLGRLRSIDRIITTNTSRTTTIGILYLKIQFFIFAIFSLSSRSSFAQR